VGAVVEKFPLLIPDFLAALLTRFIPPVGDRIADHEQVDIPFLYPFTEAFVPL
jgi:hypothetical protein